MHVTPIALRRCGAKGAFPPNYRFAPNMNDR
jgi:hypothetical protein